MNPILAFVAVSLPYVAPQTPLKWSVRLPDGQIVVAPTQDLARSRAVRLAEIEGVRSPVAEPTVDRAVPSAERRHAEEAAEELLARLDLLQTATSDDDSGVQAVAKETLDRYRDSKRPAESLHLLNAGLEKVAVERATAALGINRELGYADGAWLIGETLPLSDFDKVPAKLRPGYVALLERLEGLRAMPPAQAPTYKRDIRLKSLVPTGEWLRLSCQSVQTSKTGVALTIRLIARRDDTKRAVVVVTDRWILRNGAYVFSSSIVRPPQSEDLASAVSARIIENARAESAAIAQRHERQRVATEQKVQERADADRKEQERVQREEEQRKADQERKDREEKDRKDAEERKDRLESYRRDLDETTRNLSKARNARDDKARDLSRARDEKRDAERDADQFRRRKDELQDKVREAEQKLEDAKKDGKPTSALQSTLSELKDQLHGAERQYDDAHGRVDNADSRIRSIESDISDLESKIRQFNSDADDLRSKISQLGG